MIEDPSIAKKRNLRKMRNITLCIRPIDINIAILHCTRFFFQKKMLQKQRIHVVLSILHSVV